MIPAPGGSAGILMVTVCRRRRRRDDGPPVALEDLTADERPRPAARSLVEKKGAKTEADSAGAIPLPLSRRRRRSRCRRCGRPTRMPPAWAIAWAALTRTFRNTDSAPRRAAHLPGEAGGAAATSRGSSTRPAQRRARGGARSPADRRAGRRGGGAGRRGGRSGGDPRRGRGRRAASPAVVAASARRPEAAWSAGSSRPARR